jgi:hypothetical protein
MLLLISLEVTDAHGEVIDVEERIEYGVGLIVLGASSNHVEGVDDEFPVAVV